MTMGKNKSKALERVSQEVGEKIQDIQRLWKEPRPNKKLIEKLIQEIW